MPDSRPNIILIITDQQRYDTIAALGFPHMDTPNLDRLVREGVSFANCFVAAPSCAPSRASFFNGQYPYHTGVRKNGDAWPGSWIEDLSAGGYHCVNIGKMHTWPHSAMIGFHERYVVENKDRYLEARYFFDEWDKGLRARGLVKQQREFYRQWPDYAERLGAMEWNLPEDTHPDFFVGDMAKWWLNSYPVTQPLFLQIGFPGPHPPYDPVPRYAEPYLKRDLPMPVRTPEEIASQPAPFHQMREHNIGIDHDSVVFRPDATPEQCKRQRAYYLANMTMIDEKIGEILQTLEARGYLENSVVLFTSDHGDALGDHAHSQKWTMYDIITRVPMIVWSPGRFDGGRVISELIQQMDVAPAIMELAQVKPKRRMDGRSVLPALEGRDWTGRPYVTAEHVRDGILEGTAYMAMVRTPEWKLVHFVDAEGQLFHLSEDPQEMKNLWHHPAAQEKKNELLLLLLNERLRSDC